MAHRAPASPKSMGKVPMANESKVVNLMPTPEDFALTGISGLDSILEGGIPRSNVTLVEGAIGTGKTTMGVEFVYRGASEFDEPGLIVLFEVSPEKVVRDAAQLGWDLPALERQGRVKIVYTTRQVFRQELQQADSLLLQAAPQSGAGRRLRSEHSRNDGSSRARRGREWGVLPRQYDGRGRDLRCGQERDGAPIHRRRRASR